MPPVVTSCLCFFNSGISPRELFRVQDFLMLLFFVRQNFLMPASSQLLFAAVTKHLVLHNGQLFQPYLILEHIKYLSICLTIIINLLNQPFQNHTLPQPENSFDQKKQLILLKISNIHLTLASVYKQQTSSSLKASSKIQQIFMFFHHKS